MNLYALTPGSGADESRLVARFLGLSWARTVTWMPNQKARKGYTPPEVLEQRANVVIVFTDKLTGLVRANQGLYRVIHIPWPCPDHYSELAALRELRIELDMAFNTSGRSGVNK